MSVVYRLRFHHRASLRVEGDHELQPDYTNSIKDICRLYCEEMLAEKGFRSAAHGISRVTDKNGTRYRVQVWGEAKTKNGGIRTGHIHCGYRDTLEEAYNLQFEWWLKNRGIDLKKLICLNPGSAISQLNELMREAAGQGGDDEYWKTIISEFADDKDD